MHKPFEGDIRQEGWGGLTIREGYGGISQHEGFGGISPEGFSGIIGGGSANITNVWPFGGD